jgi:hypothetical protein
MFCSRYALPAMPITTKAMVQGIIKANTNIFFLKTRGPWATSLT